MNRRVSLTLLALALAASACTTSKPTATTVGSELPPVSTSGSGTATSQPPTPASTSAPPTTSPGEGYTPVFEEAACMFNQPAGYRADCGYLVVPEDRNDPTGSQVRLHVAIFPAMTDTPAPDPVVYLEGGPGGHALEGLEFSFEDRFAPFLAERDLIVFDQRGAGFSMPSLSCPELRALDIELLDQVLEPEQYTAREIESLTACRDRLIDDGVDITSYNSKANAADVADLRKALGIDSWNLYGISYGTRLALTTMRDDPTGVRSVILDSTVPLQVDLVASIASTADRAFGRLFGACGASAACAATFPGLEASYNELRAQLDASSVDIEVTDFISGDSYPAVLTGRDVTSLVFQSLYSEQLIPILPDVITDALDGDFTGLEQLASLFFTNDRFISFGMYLSVQCNEEYPFSNVAAVEAAVAAHPAASPLYRDIAGEFEECALWGAGTANGIEDDPVFSPLPTLVIGGEFDPITPPQFGREVTANLPNSFFYEFPGLGHGVSTAHPCPLGMTLAFLDDPATPPDSTCIGAMGGPSFLTPGNISVNLVPFAEQLGAVTVTGLVPDDWDSAGFGQYSAPGLGDTAIVQQARPIAAGLTVDSMAAGIADFFDIADWERSTYTGASRTWDLFEGTDGRLQYVMGLRIESGFLLMVILASPADVLEDYRTAVFLPALDAIDVAT